MSTLIHRVVAICILSSFGLNSEVWAQEPGKTQPATITAQKGVARAELTVQGIVMARNASEISVSPLTAQTFKVVKAIPFGALVKEGDILVEFDTKAFSDQLIDQNRAVSAAEMALKDARRELDFLHKQNPLDIEQAELTWAQAQEDYKYYTETERPFEVRATEQTLKSSKDFLDYTHEELKQLEKMYKADDLTEESEEIVLRRARDDYERQRFSFERTQMQNDRQKNVLQPRSEKQKQTAFRLAEIAYEKSRLTLPEAIAKKEFDLQKLERDLDKARRTLDELNADEKCFQVYAPRSGYVYYGRAVNGKWDSGNEMKNKLRSNGTIAANEVFMTVVDNSELSVIANVPEAECNRIVIGQIGQFAPTSNPNAAFRLAVSRRNVVPNADGTMEAVFDLEKVDRISLVAGQNGAAKIVTAQNDQAVLVPAKSVFADDKIPAARFVYQFKPDGKHVRVDVKVGIAMGDQLEILAGVAAGDVLLAEKPN